MNAPVMVEIGRETDPLRIAQMELRQRKIPIIIRRYLPDHSQEHPSYEVPISARPRCHPARPGPGTARARPCGCAM